MLLHFYSSEKNCFPPIEISLFGINNDQALIVAIVVLNVFTTEDERSKTSKINLFPKMSN